MMSLMTADGADQWLVEIVCRRFGRKVDKGIRVAVRGETSVFLKQLITAQLAVILEISSSDWRDRQNLRCVFRLSRLRVSGR